jgi:hypothetical protein
MGNHGIQLNNCGFSVYFEANIKKTDRSTLLDDPFGFIDLWHQNYLHNINLG